MKHLVVLILSGMLGLYSCTIKDSACDGAIKFEEADFNTNITLTRDTNWSIELPSAHRILLLDSIILVLDLKSDVFITVIDVNTKNVIGRFLNRGHGPNEIINTWNINYSQKQNSVWFHDPNNKKTVVYDVKDIRNIRANSTILPIQVLNFDKTFDNVLILSKDTIIASPIDFKSQYRFEIMDISGNIFNKFIKYPKFTNIEGDNFFMIFESEFIVNEEQSRIGIFNKLTDLLEIYTLQGDAISLRQGPDNFEPKYKINANKSISMIDDKTRRGYYHPIERAGIIWSLYSGNLIEDPTQYNKIATFDWKGTPNSIYHLSDNINSFDIDTVHNYIYGLRNINGIDEIVRYRFN